MVVVGPLSLISSFRTVIWELTSIGGYKEFCCGELVLRLEYVGHVATRRLANPVGTAAHGHETADLDVRRRI